MLIFMNPSPLTSWHQCLELAQAMRQSGLVCPHCQGVSKDHVLTDGSPDRCSYFVCALCDRSFRPDHFPQHAFVSVSSSAVDPGQTTILYRPVGQKELDLIGESGYKEFPPRLAEQPIFYPVLNEAYATQIARDWNAGYNEDKVGYVTRFRVRADFLLRYEVKVVGGSEHEEYWIPAEELEEFNRNIVGEIEVIAEYRGGD